MKILKTPKNGHFWVWRAITPRGPPNSKKVIIMGPCSNRFLIEWRWFQVSTCSEKSYRFGQKLMGTFWGNAHLQISRATVVRSTWAWYLFMRHKNTHNTWIGPKFVAPITKILQPKNWFCENRKTRLARAACARAFGALAFKKKYIYGIHVLASLAVRVTLGRLRRPRL